jgi:hypothetical protein
MLCMDGVLGISLSNNTNYTIFGTIHNKGKFITCLCNVMKLCLSAKMIFVTQYKTDPHNTTYTKLAQVDTGNTIYTNIVFLFGFFFVSLRMQYAKNRPLLIRSKSANLCTYLGSENYFLKTFGTLIFSFVSLPT